MTKKEFLSIIESELETLKKEYREVKYHDMIIQEKLNALNKLVSLPIYARIQTMSDTEVEEYKKSKVDELELKIKEIESKKEQKDVKNNLNIISKLEMAKGKLKEYQEQIKAMTSEETKKQLSLMIKESDNLAQEIENSKKPIDEFTELKASMTHDNIDSKTRNTIASLLADYKNECEVEMRDSKGYINIASYGYLPKALIEKMGGNPYTYEYDISNQENVLNDLIKLVQEFEDGPFKQRQDLFYSQCTPNKLFNLVKKREVSTEANPSEVTVDVEFLQQHTDKLEDGQLAHLESLVGERTKISKKIFKTKDTKSKISTLNHRISQEQGKVYETIIDWYKNEGFFDTTDFLDLNNLERALEDRKRAFIYSQQEIQELKAAIQREKALSYSIHQEHEIKKAKIAQQVRELAGEKYKETNILFEPIEQTNYYGHGRSESLRDFAEAQGKIYEKEIIDKVQREAKKQADIRENELKGISKKVNPLQAKQVDKQIDEMLDELNIETLDAEVSHDMKK